MPKVKSNSTDLKNYSAILYVVVNDIIIKYLYVDVIFFFIFSVIIFVYIHFNNVFIFSNFKINWCPHVSNGVKDRFKIYNMLLPV